jgi:hypothetical protein
MTQLHNIYMEWSDSLIIDQCIGRDSKRSGSGLIEMLFQQSYGQKNYSYQNYGENTWYFRSSKNPSFSAILNIGTFQRQRESINCKPQLNILSYLIDDLCFLSSVYIYINTISSIKISVNTSAKLLSCGRFTIRPLVFSVLCL